MNLTLVKALIALLPASVLLTGALQQTGKTRNAPALLQLAGAGCLLVVALTHVCEALGLFRTMQWGQEHSAGHYVDLASAVLGLSLLPFGYLWAALRSGPKTK